MSMPGGIDGSETIKRILQLDNQMLCAVVTAYTDRSPDQLATLFKKQDDWLYFNKPFTIGELQQTAYHLVTAWNQRREMEALISNMKFKRQNYRRSGTCTGAVCVGWNAMNVMWAVSSESV